MKRYLKVGFTLIVIGSLLLFTGYTMLTSFRDREEDIDRIYPEETLAEHGIILAINFCGGIFLLGGLIVLIIKILDIDVTSSPP